MEPSSKGALVALIGAPKGGGMGSDLSEDPKPSGASEPYGSSPGAMPEKSEYGDHSFKALAKAFGLPPERQGSAQAALKQYIRACLSELEEEEPDE